MKQIRYFSALVITGLTLSMMTGCSMSGMSGSTENHTATTQAVQETDISVSESQVHIGTPELPTEYRIT